MEILNINSSQDGDVIVLKEDTELKIDGTVKLKQIVCAGFCKHLVISGDVLYVDNPEHGIAIGNDARWGLSYGRFEYSSLVTDIYIDCKEIHAHSATKGCGIGCYGIKSAKRSWFSDNCEIIDTPIDMIIYNKPLSGSTKRSVLPVYMTQEEMKEKENEATKVFNKNMLQHLAVQVFKHETSIRFEDIYNDRIDERLLEKFYFYIAEVFYRADKDTFVGCLRRAFASIVSAIIDMPGSDANQYIVLYDIVAYTALCRELVLFDKVARYPLSMRYRQVLYDFTFDGLPEYKETSNMSSFGELHLTDELIANYNHPTDMDYTKGCKRFWYGMPVHLWDDSYNDLVQDRSEVIKTLAVQMKDTTVPYGIRNVEHLYALVISKDGLNHEVIKIEDNKQVLTDGRSFGLVGAEIICTDICKRLNGYNPDD